MHSRLFFGIAVIIGLTTSFLSAPPARGGESVTSLRSTERVSNEGPCLFELSLGYNYIHLDRPGIEQEHLHGVDFSAFVNITRSIGLGGDFMANFGSHEDPFFSNVDLTSRRYVYLFGPRITLWQNSHLRFFTEILAGGVHAELEASLGSLSRTFHENSFAAAVGGGLDWRFTRNIAWRIFQADYLPTNLGNDWQNNFRASTGIVFSFGGKQ